MELKTKQSIRCNYCGFGVLSKKRERRPVVYDAI